MSFGCWLAWSKKACVRFGCISVPSGEYDWTMGVVVMRPFCQITLSTCYIGWVCAAVILIIVTAKVPIHLMNVDRAQDDCCISDWSQPTWVVSPLLGYHCLHASSELRKVLFLALSVIFFLCVWNILDEAVQKCQNWSRCILGVDLGGSKEACFRLGCT